MSIGSAAGRRVGYVRQSAKDSMAQASDAATAIRRSTTSLNLSRDAYKSNEKRLDHQHADSGLGTHRVTGSIEGEAFTGAWKDLQESLLARNWGAVTTISATSGDGFTIVGSTGVLTRAAGGARAFLTDGLLAGMVVKITALHASVNNKLAYVSAVTATTVTLKFLDGTTATDVSTPDTDATIVIPGKYTYIPSSGFTKHFYTIEDYFSDMANAGASTGDQATVFWNVFVNGGTLTFSPNNFATWSFDLIGDGHTQDYEGSSAPYLSSVSAVGTERAFRCSAIWLLVDGVVVGTVTQGSIQITRNANAPAVVGSNYSPDIIVGMFDVTWNLTVLLEDLSYRAKLRGETEFAAAVVMQEVGGTNFFNIGSGRLKLTSHSVDDADTGLSQSFTAEALKAVAATGVNSTTLWAQDSAA